MTSGLALAVVILAAFGSVIWLAWRERYRPVPPRPGPHEDFWGN